MDILLHLGAHRCASTTFQSFLSANRTALSKQGLTCWPPKRTRDGLMRGLIRHPAMITLEDERQGFRSVGRMRIEMDRLAHQGQSRLLLSEQNILGSMRNNILETRLYPLLRERLLRFKPAFEGRRLLIGLAIRSYEDYWTSCLDHLIMRGHAVPSVDLLDFLTTQPRRWRMLVREIASVFPDADIVVWPFERLANQPEAQLRAIVQADLTATKSADLWCNRGADVLSLNETLALRGEPLAQDGPVVAGTRWMPFDEDQRNVLRAEYRRDLSWLASGADGLAEFYDGKTRPTPAEPDAAVAFRSLRIKTGSGRSTLAPCPDRADVTHNAAFGVVPFRGHEDGIEETRR